MIKHWLLLLVLVTDAATTNRAARFTRRKRGATIRKRAAPKSPVTDESTDVMGYQVTVEKGLKGIMWLVSHGGVKSEWLHGRMGLPSKWHQVMPSRRPFRGVTAHYPRPVAGPKMAVYVFGDVYNSVVSQLRRHPYNPAKLHNSRSFPWLKFDNVVAHSKVYDDVYGIEGQFMNWMTIPANYPIIFVRTDKISKEMFGILGPIVGVKMKDFNLRERKSHWEEQPAPIKDMLVSQYWRLNALFNVMPPVTIKYPPHQQMRSAQEIVSGSDIPDFWYATNTARQLVSDLFKSPIPFDHAVASHLSKFGYREKHFIAEHGLEVFNYRCKGRKPKQKYVCPSGIITRCHMKVTAITQKSKGYGYEDLRTLWWRDEMWIVTRGNPPHDKKRKAKLKHAQYLINVCSGKSVYLQSPTTLLQGKNWLPYNDRGRLRFVYSFKDKTMVDSILELVDSNTGEIRIVHSIGNVPAYHPTAGIFPSFLTPYQYPIFAGFAHTHESYRGQEQSIYKSGPILFNAENFRIVYKGAVSFPDATQDYARGCTRQWRQLKRSIVWTHAMQFNDESVIVSNNIQDLCTMVHRFTIEEMGEMLHLDQAQYDYLYEGTKKDFIKLKKKS